MNSPDSQSQQDEKQVPKSFSHLKNNQPQMVDISGKAPTLRVAEARGVITLDKAILSGMNRGKEQANSGINSSDINSSDINSSDINSSDINSSDINSSKGPIIKTAIIAGTMAVKKTSELIPFAHPLLLSAINFSTSWQGNKLSLSCEVKTRSNTGVEMEALTGVSVALLTIYDMCKSISSDMVIGEIKLFKKTGGKKDIDISK